MTTQVLKWRPRGPILFADRDDTFTPAQPKVFAGENCADQVSLALNIAYVTHTTKCTALDVEDFRAIKSLAAEVTIDLSDYTIPNLIAALNAGEVVAETIAAAVTGEEFPTVAAGDKVMLGDANAAYNITALTITDSASPPATLALTTNYKLDATNGMVEIVALPIGVVQPLVAAYSHKNPPILAALAAGQIERWIRFNGFNTANANKAVNVNMFRVQLSPTAAFDLLPDNTGSLQLKGSVLADLTRSTSDPRGQFFDVALAA